VQLSDSVAAIITDWRTMSLEEKAGARSRISDRLRAIGVSRPERLLDTLVETSSTATADGAPTPDDAGSTIVRSLADILADPAALASPAVVVPRLAWRGRVTLLAAREKAGKSTLATAAAAAVSSGTSWLGDATEAGPVLWVGLEEHVGDLAARMSAWSAIASRVYVINCLSTVDDPIAEIHRASSTLRPALVVVDTLAALADATDARPDPGSSSAWTPIMSSLARVARSTDAALILAHHARKSDGAYRDSSAIGAGVDAIIEMAEGDEADVRRFRVRARWRVGDYAVRLVGERYELAAGELSLDARVLLYVEAHPGSSQRAVEKAIQARATDVRSAIQRLTASGAISDRGTAGTMRLYTGTHSGTHSAQGADAHGRIPGRAPDAGGTQPDALSGRTVSPAAEPLASEAGRTTADALSEACDV
jgi:hypothetical protein